MIFGWNIFRHATVGLSIGDVMASGVFHKKLRNQFFTRILLAIIDERAIFSKVISP